MRIRRAPTCSLWASALPWKRVVSQKWSPEPSSVKGGAAAGARRHQGSLCGGASVHGQVAAGKLQPVPRPGPRCSGAQERLVEVQARKLARVCVGQPCLSATCRSAGCCHAAPGRANCCGCKRQDSHRVASHVLLERLGPLDHRAPSEFAWPRPGRQVPLALQSC